MDEKITVTMVLSVKTGFFAENIVRATGYGSLAKELEEVGKRSSTKVDSIDISTELVTVTKINKHFNGEDWG